MAIVAGFDVHRAQITFDALDTETGEVMRGRIDATPAAVTRWVKRFGRCEIDVAVEACTGWLFVCDALTAAGAAAHLAEPVETRALRGRKRRAKTDRRGRPLAARTARRRQVAGGVDPARARPAMALAGQVASHADRRAHPVDAAHPGDALSPRRQRHAGEARTHQGRAFMDALDVPVDARERIEIALAMVEAIEAQIAPLERELRQLARRQTGCRALMGLYGGGRADLAGHAL